VRALVLTGAGRILRRQDLNDRSVTPEDRDRTSGESIDTYYKPLVLALRRHAQARHRPVNGVAGRGRCQSRARLRRGDRAARRNFIQGVCKAGLVRIRAGTYCCRAPLARPGAGLALFATSSRHQAAQWGLIWKCVDDPR